MNLRINITLFLLTILLPLSISQVYYEPDEGNMLALNKHDLSFSLTLGSSVEKRNSKSFKIGYSPIKHLAVQGGVYKSNYTYSKDWEKTNFKAWDAALGTYYFLPLDKEAFAENRSKIGALLDLYFGYSNGNVFNQYSTPLYGDLNFQKLYIQTGIHLKSSLFGAQFAVKTGTLSFLNGDYTNLISFEDEPIESFTTAIDEESARFTTMIFRLNLNLRYGNIFFSQTLSKFDKGSNIETLDNVYHIGIQVDVDDFFKKRMKTN